MGYQSVDFILDDNRTVKLDAKIYAELFSDTPETMLAIANNNVGYLLKLCLGMSFFRDGVTATAERYKLDFNGVLRSVSRTLHETLHAR